MPRRPLVALIGLMSALTLACGKGEDADTGIDLCSPNTPTLETQGGFGEESISFTWTGDRSGSWGPWMYRRLPDNLVSLGVSVDGREAWTGFGTLALDEEVFIDLGEDEGWSAWGDEPFFHYATPGATVAGGRRVGGRAPVAQPVGRIRPQDRSLAGPRAGLLAGAHPPDPTQRRFRGPAMEVHPAMTRGAP